MTPVDAALAEAEARRKERERTLALVELEKHLQALANKIKEQKK